MTDAPRGSYLPTFMTHDMSDDDILGVSTGRENELNDILKALQSAYANAPSTLQHVIVYGSRGFGKSFMMRRVQIEAVNLCTADAPIHFILLPEEQHNLQRSPHALLETIATKIEYRDRDDAGFTSALFQWPRPEEEERRWIDAETRLEGALDALLAGGKGLVVVALENFDNLLATLFKHPTDEQRLRRWLDRAKNRVMLLASATGTVDLDYDRPLFQAFRTIRLLPWTPNECLDYFNRLRERGGREPLNSAQSAKALAISDFIGGTPRLARVLAEVIDTQDALSVADTLSALADHLAEYYRRRIEDLPPLARGLLDALIRGGEPASQTQLAERVGADGQNTIARTMSELQQADIIRGRPAPDSRETLYRVTDRVFAHYYRLRQGSEQARHNPLTTILDFLRSFYSRDEQRDQAWRYLDAGQFGAASVFGQLARENEWVDERGYTDDLRLRLDAYLSALPEAEVAPLRALATLLNEAPERAYDACKNIAVTSAPGRALLVALQAQAGYRVAGGDKAKDILETELDGHSDWAARVILINEICLFLIFVKNDHKNAVNIFAKEKVNLSDLRYYLHKDIFYIYALRFTWVLSRFIRNDDALDTVNKIAKYIKKNGDKVALATVLRHKAVLLSALDRFRHAQKMNFIALRMSENVGDSIGCMYIFSEITRNYFELGNFEEGLVFAQKWSALAQGLSEFRQEAYSYLFIALVKIIYKLSDVAIDYLKKSIEVCERIQSYDVGLVSRVFLSMTLMGKGKNEEAFNYAQVALDRFYDSSPFDDLIGVICRLTPYLSEGDASSVWRKIENILYENVSGEKTHILLKEVKYLFNNSFRSGAFSNLDHVLETHADLFIRYVQHFSFSNSDGKALADVSREVGRAETYRRLSALLPRIATFVARLSPQQRDDSWLTDLIRNFAADCRDSGILRDTASLLTPAIAPDAPALGGLLIDLARLDESADPEKILARLDPDRALVLRRLRDLPEPPIRPKRLAAPRRHR